MQDVLEIVFQTSPQDENDINCLLDFFTVYAKAAPIPQDDISQIKRELNHISSGLSLKSDQQDRLFKIYSCFTNRGIKKRKADYAIALGMTGYNCASLTIQSRRILLASLTENNYVNEEVIAAIKTEMSGESDKELTKAILKRAMRKGSACDPFDELEKAKSVLSLAKLSVEICPDTSWAYGFAWSAFLVLNRLEEASSVLEQGIKAMPDKMQFKYSLALTKFRQGKYKDAVSILAGLEEQTKFPSERLESLCKAGILFCNSGNEIPRVNPGELEFIQLDSLEELEEDQILGSALPYIRGRLLVACSKLTKSIEFFKKAASFEDTPLYVYYAIHSCQLAGLWGDARQLLEKSKVDSEAITCLKLRQLFHDFGSISGQDQRFEAGIGDVSSQSDLVTARQALLSGHPTDKIISSRSMRREVFEECYRLNISSVLSGRNTEQFLKLMLMPLWNTLPSAERRFFEGICEWLSGNNDIAERYLEAAAMEAPGLIGAFKLLALIRSEKGEVFEAVRELKRVKLNAPHDYRSLFRLAISQYRAGKIPEAVTLLKRIKGDNEKFAEYLIGRIKFDKMLKEVKYLIPPKTKRKRSKSRNRLLAKLKDESLSLSRFFAKFSIYRDSAWYSWVCNVLSETPDIWRAKRNIFLSQKPGETEIPIPVEAQWVDALLRTTFVNFDVAITGIEDLIHIADSQENPGIRESLSRDILIAFSIASDKARDPAHFIKIFDNLDHGKFGKDKAYRELQSHIAISMLQHNIRNLSTIYEILSDHADLDSVEFEFQLYGTITGILESNFEKVSGIIDNIKRKSSENKVRVHILDGICAIAKGNNEAFNKILNEAETNKADGRWEAVKTLGGVKFDQPYVIDSLCTMIDSFFKSTSRSKMNPILSMSLNIDTQDGAIPTAVESSSRRKPLSLKETERNGAGERKIDPAKSNSGILYYLTHNVLSRHKDKKDKVVGTICRINPENLSGDFETALALVRALVLLEKWERVLPVLPVLENAPSTIKKEIEVEISGTICHCAVNALEEKDFILAHKFLNTFGWRWTS